MFINYQFGRILNIDKNPKNFVFNKNISDLKNL